MAKMWFLKFFFLLFLLQFIRFFNGQYLDATFQHFQDFILQWNFLRAKNFRYIRLLKYRKFYIYLEIGLINVQDIAFP